LIPEGLLVAGDAAGFVDPMTGDGLRFAVRGGELVADAALTHARFRDHRPGGRRVAGAPGAEIGAGVSLNEVRGFCGDVELRYFGARSHSDSALLRLAARLSYALRKDTSVSVEVAKLLSGAGTGRDYLGFEKSFGVRLGLSGSF
jgi:hypothetical protein